MIYRVLRTPVGIEVLAEEDGLAVDQGYRLVLLGAYDAEVKSLLDQLRRRVREAIREQYLERLPIATDGSCEVCRSRGGWYGGTMGPVTTLLSMGGD